MNTKTTLCLLVPLALGAVVFAVPPTVPFHTTALTLRSPDSRPASSPAAQHFTLAADQTPASIATPAPGLYAAVPYSAIVAVPAPTDPKFLASPGGHPDRTALVESPAIKLVPLQRR
jgi:hypothetical protein